LVRPFGHRQCFLGGRVVGLENTVTGTRAIHALNDKMHLDSRVEISMLPIGDGLMLARKR
jgi:caffeoyl-CoA O-methyltransferase